MDILIVSRAMTFSMLEGSPFALAMAQVRPFMLVRAQSSGPLNATVLLVVPALAVMAEFRPLAMAKRNLFVIRL